MAHAGGGRAGSRTGLLALIVGLLALAVLAAGVAAAALADGVGLVEAVAAVPLGGFLALLALSLARRARIANERSLGRAGGGTLAGLARGVGLTALLVAVTGALALAVFVVLLLCPGLAE